MANYYTTRFNPYVWPPPQDLVPPGVQMTPEELLEAGHLCCGIASINSIESQPSSINWRYRIEYSFTCETHGDSQAILSTFLDWISPNEYLLIRTSSHQE